MDKDVEGRVDEVTTAMKTPDELELMIYVHGKLEDVNVREIVEACENTGQNVARILDVQLRSDDAEWDKDEEEKTPYLFEGYLSSRVIVPSEEEEEAAGEASAATG